MADGYDRAHLVGLARRVGHGGGDGVAVEREIPFDVGVFGSGEADGKAAVVVGGALAVGDLLGGYGRYRAEPPAVVAERETGVADNVVGDVCALYGIAGVGRRRAVNLHFRPEPVGDVGLVHHGLKCGAFVLFHIHPLIIGMFAVV